MTINYPSDWTNMNPHVPFIGKWKAKATLIEQMWMQPCGVTPTLAAFGAFVALPELVFSVLQPDCLDHTFDRVGRPHRRRRKPTFNIADFMDPLAAPKGGAGWALYQGAKLAQRIGFYALLVDSFENWIIAGTSLSFRMAGCEDPQNGFCNLKMDNIVVALLPAQSFTINTWQLQDQHIFSGGGTGIATPSGQAVGASFSLSQNVNTIPSLPDAAWTARIIDTVTGESSGILDPYNGPGDTPNLAYALPNAGRANSSHFYQIRMTKEFGVLNMSGTFTAGGANLQGIGESACGHSLRGFD